MPEPTENDAQPKSYNPLFRFFILAFIPIIIVVAIIGGLSSFIIVDSMVKDETNNTSAYLRLIAGKFLTKRDFNNKVPQREKIFGFALESIFTSSHEYKRIKVYDANGTILWSDKKELINKNFYYSNEELKEALTGEVVSKYGALTEKMENIHEAEYGKGLEIYVPIRKEGKVVGVIEVYRIPSDLVGKMNRGLLIIWAVVALGGFFIHISLFWIVKSSYKAQLALESRIMQSKDRLMNLIDGIRDGIALIDNECNMLTINKALAGRFKLPLKEVIGKSINTIFHDGNNKDIKRMCDKTCRNARPALFDIEIDDEKTKKKAYIKVNCFPITAMEHDNDNENRKNYQAVIVFRDITKEKELTQELLRAEKFVTIGTLFPKISHEIRSPLNALELGLVTLKERYPDDSIIDLLLGSKENLLRISNDLLVFSRHKSEQFSYVNVNDVLRKVIYFLKETTGQIKYHKIIEEYKSDLLINGNFGQLEQLFINLVINASHAMEHLMVAEQILSVGTYDEGNNVMVYIKDVGTGIKKEDYDKIFDPFFTTKPEGKGTGLGLAIIQEIAISHGADVTFETEEGKGTVFYVKFDGINIDEAYDNK